MSEIMKNDEYKSRNQLDMNWTKDKYWSERRQDVVSNSKAPKKAYIKGARTNG